ncbi:GspE/PulE family protein [Aeromonas caviae]|uniref:GspE/PulE family protein n=1 Tax=Aeromonas caviae TaxID=648 RepID=UPI0030DD41E9
MTVANSFNFSVLDNDSIMTLCREDGNCFVDSDLNIHVAHDGDARRDSLIAVINAVRNLRHGAEPNINLISADSVSRTLQEGFSLENTPKGSSGDKNQDTEVSKRLKNILTLCLKKGASDIHILVKNHKTSIKVRVDGRLVPLMTDQNKEYGAELTALIFGYYSGSEEPYSPLTPNAGSFTERLSINGEPARPWDWRSSLLPNSSTKDDTECTKTVLRCLTPINDHVPSFEEMGMHQDHISILTDAFNQAHGGILISGPTGSGKTTLAMAALNTIPDHRNVNTLEDPPEWALSGISQTRIDYGKNAKGDTRDFAFYGKVLFRQDPDVIFFGELRDKRSAAEFTHLGESGHLVFGTTHTSSATGIVTKIVDHLAVPKSVAGSPDVFSVFTHQRLARKLCPKCSIPFDQAPEEKKKLLTKSLGNNLGKCRVRNPSGCSHCIEGEKGRTLVMEVIAIKDADRDFIAEGDALRWRRALIEGGWKPIQHYAREKVREGVCDIESVAEQIRDLI